MQFWDAFSYWPLTPIIVKNLGTPFYQPWAKLNAYTKKITSALCHLQ
jgi:hypothetical protein